MRYPDYTTFTIDGTVFHDAATAVANAIDALDDTFRSIELTRNSDGTVVAEVGGDDGGAFPEIYVFSNGCREAYWCGGEPTAYDFYSWGNLAPIDDFIIGNVQSIRLYEVKAAVYNLPDGIDDISDAPDDLDASQYYETHDVAMCADVIR